MPLLKDASEESFKKNVEEMLSAGHPREQALAAAYRIRREAGWDGDEGEHREFMKGGANVHVKAHYRVHNGKLVYVHEHEKAGQIGHEAQLHERVQFGKNKAHLLSVDPEDRDAVAKHASALGIKHETVYQGGKIRDHEGNVEKHGFYYHKFENEEDAKKVHAAMAASGSAYMTGDEVPFEGLKPGMELGEGKNKAVVQSVMPDGVEFKIGASTTTVSKDQWKQYKSKLLFEGQAAPAEAPKVEEKHADPKGDASPWGEDTVDNVKSWVEKKAKEYGGMQKFTSSPEYHAVYDKVKGIYDSYKKDWDEKTSVKTKADMEAAGVKFGDKIAVRLPNMMGLGGTTVVGTLAKKGAQAVVKFDHKLPTVEGQKSVVWTPSMKKATAEDTGEAPKPKPSLQAMKYPSGKWGFAGKDFYVHEDGTPATDKELSEMNVSQNPSWKAQEFGLKKKIFDSKEDAEKFSDEMGMGGEKKPEASKEEIQPESSPYPSGWDDNPSYHLKDAMMQAEGAFHADPKGAIALLRKGAALAKKHGIDYTHANGMKVDADWMEKKASEMEAALPKEEPVNEEYTKAAQEAMSSSAAAHESTKGLVADRLNGEHTPEKAGETMKGHASAGNKHVKAFQAHKAAAEKAPTPELKAFHEKKAEEHNNHAEVHAQAMEMHGKQHAKNQAQENYDTEASKADAETVTANQHTHASATSESSEDHETGSEFHESAAKAHTNMIQHALANGDEQAANEHASIASQHRKKAAYHKAAAEAWKATNEGGENPASKHSAAAQAAEEAGLAVAMGKHDKQSQAHLQAQKTQKLAANPHAKKAEEASDEAKDWSWTPNMEPDQHVKAAKAHNIAGGAHMKAAEGAEEGDKQGHYAQAKHHSNMVDYHNKAGQASKISGEAEAFHGVESKHNSSEHEQAAKLHAQAASEHEALSQHPGIKDSKKHQEFHAEAAAHHQEMAEKHAKFAASQKAQESEDAGGDSEAAKKAEPTKPDFSKYDHAPIAKKGLEAYQKGDWAEAAKSLKQAAVIALHKGNKEEANGYAAKAKAAMLKLSPVQKAMAEEEANLGVLRIAVMESARAVHQEKLQVRNLLKAVDTLPSFGNLQKACANATRAGITDLDTIVAHALGGKQQAAPYLKFIAAIQ